jgi:hypothetical protein
MVRLEDLTPNTTVCGIHPDAPPPVNPDDRKKGFGAQWKGAAGLAADVRYYGKWMRDEAQKRMGHLYPKVEITAEMARERPDLQPYIAEKLTAIAWLRRGQVPGVVVETGSCQPRRTALRCLHPSRAVSAAAG